MATRSIFRSAVEPGKAGYHRVERKGRDRTLRVQNRILAQKAKLYGSDLDDVETYRTPAGKYSGQRDKLNPLRRYLRSRVGQKFDDVRSELARREDQRTVQGWHINRYHGQTDRGHLWDYVHYCYEWPNACSDRRYSWRSSESLEIAHQGEFFVANDGILRYGGDRVSYYRQNHPKTKTKKKAPKNQLRVTDTDRDRFRSLIYEYKIENHGPQHLYWLQPYIDKITGEKKYARSRELTKIEKALYREAGGRDHKNTVV